MENETIILAENITKKYPSKTLYQNINLKLEQGKSYALTGASGAGKSTLLNILSGLEKSDSGKVLINNQLLSKSNLKKLRQTTIGYLFQNYGLMDDKTVAANLELGLYFAKLNKKQKEEQMRNQLDKLGLISVPLNRKVYTLSGGEQQRVALARLLLKQPQIVFADEPTGALDDANTALILDHLLGDLAPQTTLVIATHDTAVTARCDYQIHVADQKVTMTKVN